MAMIVTAANQFCVEKMEILQEDNKSTVCTDYRYCFSLNSSYIYM